MKPKRTPPPDLTWPSHKLRNKEVHLVCPAHTGLNTFGALCTLFVSDEEAHAHTLRVNRANETGTLYPKGPITIVPVSIFEERNDFRNATLMKKHIEDCFVANEQYWKIPHLYFCFDSGHVFDCELALTIVEEALESREFEYTREISTVIV